MKNVKQERCRLTTVRTALKIAVMLAVAGALTMTAFANENPANPANIQTETMNTLVTLVFWAVRLLILAIGGIPALIKITQGQTNEDNKERNAGITAAIVTGIMFAASFGIEALFSE
jgi:heme/copper-type cytochrome/quinol oxidase subunit 2